MGKAKTPARAFYDGVLGGCILGTGIAFLLILYVFGQSGQQAPIDVQYEGFALLVLGIIIVGYDAHKVTSVPVPREH